MCNDLLKHTIAASLGTTSQTHFMAPEAGGQVTGKPARKKLWEIAHYYHCSVIGTCFDLGELRNIAHKFNKEDLANCSDYDLHHWFVVACAQSSLISKKLNKRLEQKFASDIRRFGLLEQQEELLKEWRKAKTEGKVAGPFWAIISRRDVSEATLHTVYGDIHMLSHLAGASCRVDQQKLVQYQAENVTLLQEINQVKDRLLTQQSEKDSLAGKLNVERTRHKTTRKQLQTTEEQLESAQHDSDTASLQNLIDKLSRQLLKVNQQLKQSRDNEQTLREEVNSLRQQCQLLESRAHQATEDTIKHARDERQNDCPGPDLCGKKILYVGGRIASCPHLKTATETINGCFLYHDGGLEDNPHKLTTALQQADVVFFPADCVSHEASNRVRELCDRLRKPFVPLKSTGISHYRENLWRFASTAPESLPT